jgi:nitrogen regulatory protein PII
MFREISRGTKTEGAGHFYLRNQAMKRIEATVRHFTLDAVKAALGEAGVEGMTISEVRSIDGERRTLTYRGATEIVDAIPKVHVVAIVSDRKVDEVIHAILRTARTGKEGDGNVVVSHVESVTSVQTGETDVDDTAFATHENRHTQRTAAHAPSRWDVPSYQHSW